MVRSMLVTKKILKQFWPEALRWSFHVLNRCLTYVVKGKTLEEAWSGKVPTVEYFRVFGCLVYAHILAEKSLNWMIEVKIVYSLG